MYTSFERVRMLYKQCSLFIFILRCNFMITVKKIVDKFYCVTSIIWKRKLIIFNWKFIAPSPVWNVTASDITSESLKLHWNRPKKENGIVRYDIYMRGRNIEGNETIIANDLETLSYLVETDIEPYTNYSFYVEAFTSEGFLTLCAARNKIAELNVRSDSASKIFCILFSMKVLD